VVRDLFREHEEDKACELELHTWHSRPKDSYTPGLTLMRSGNWRYHGGDSASLQTSALSETERCNPDLLRARYIGYLRAQVVASFGGMTRHIVSGVKEGGASFTYSNCYLTPGNQLMLNTIELDLIGNSERRMLYMHFEECVPKKRDVIYGRPTEKSLRSPHPSGRPTLLWINVSEHPGLDAFIRFCLFTSEERAAHDPADAIRCTRDADGTPTVFSQLIEGYYEPTKTQCAINPEFARMMETVCWDFDLPE
jgi:hypothetical protein